MPKTYAFIDSQNLNLGVKSLGWSLDFRKFRIFLKDKYKVDKAFLFIGKVKGRKKLYSFLKKSGYILIFKPTLIFKNKGNLKVKGNVDAELILQTMIEWPNYDQAIIVSGDGDFYCLIDYLKNKNKLSKLIVPNNFYSSLLRKFASDIVLIKFFKNKIENKKGGIC